ncbi:hypothetical protein [Viridibacillus arvi]|uniref:hypothetical protein n=1 Tax=Viridibacillus arvi TaxID=263475 RepID=UPI0034CDCAEE
MDIQNNLNTIQQQIQVYKKVLKKLINLPAASTLTRDGSTRVLLGYDGSKIYYINNETAALVEEDALVFAKWAEIAI